jgi:autoinducer 2-binding protein LuxP
MNDDTGIAIAEAINNDRLDLPVPQIYSGRFVIVTQQHSAKQIQQFSNTAFRYSGS